MRRQPDDNEDAAEVWGRLVGRALGYGAALLLLLNLFARWI
jgi:hypothetical protein